MPPYRILVVDDEESVRDIVCSMLASAGYQHHGATDGLDALSLLESGEHFDLMLTDLMMPKLDGIGLLEKTKGMLPKMPVIMLTSVRDPDVRTAAFRRGVADFLLLPCTREELVVSVRKVLDKHGSASRRVLIADHEPVVADLINALLKQDGYETMVVYSSADAVQKGPGFHPGLVIIDPIMPGLSGVEVATRLGNATGSKTLFLTTLAADRDFKEVLHGIRHQGLECGALSKPFGKDQLLSFARRELGPVILLTDAAETTDDGINSHISSHQAPSPAPAFAAAPARQPLSDFEPLLAICNVSLYETNAFRITGLDVDASLRDLARVTEKMEMSNKLGVVNDHGGIFPPRTTPDTAAIRSAFQKLKDPEQRLLHEFFWFWPVAPSSKEDAALKALREHSYERAVSLWKETEKDDGTGVVAHNLAVYYHLAALEDEITNASSINSGLPKAGIPWQSSYKYWGKLLNHHAYWDRMVARIQEIADPRLTINSAERIWFSLPLALLSINARLAVAAAEKGNFEEAGRQRRLMFDSGLGQQKSIEAFRRALVPVREELTRICSGAELEARANPKTANAVVRKLFSDKKRLLQAFNYLLGAGDQMRDAVFDLVSQTGRTCLVAYANETTDWAAAQMLFEECLALAEGKSLRARLEEDLEVIAGNLAGQRSSQTQQSPNPTPQAAAGKAAPPVPKVSPSSKPSNRSGWAVLAVIGFFVIAGVVKGCEDDTNSSSATPSSSYSQPKSTVVDPPAPIAEGGNANSQPSYSSNASLEIAQLNSEIEANKSRLRIIESDLQSSQVTLDGYKARIDADKARLQQIERDNQMGLAVDESEYELVRRRHNSTVTMYNDAIAEYNQKVAQHKELLRSTNGQIERYNALIRSR